MRFSKFCTINNYDSNAVGLNLNLSNIVHTRSNSYKLDKHRPKYDLRKFFFSERVVEWNSLPPSILLKIDLTNTGPDKRFCITIKQSLPGVDIEVMLYK